METNDLLNGVPINIFASVVDKCGYLFRLKKHFNLRLQRPCVTGRNRRIIYKEKLGKFK